MRSEQKITDKLTKTLDAIKQFEDFETDGLSDETKLEIKEAHMKLVVQAETLKYVLGIIK